MSNVMICSAGRRVSLVSYFQESLRELVASDAKVLTSDLAPDYAPACRISDGSLQIGRFSDPNYIPTLIDFCLENNVSIVIPTIDTELELLAKNQQRFAEVGIHAIVSSLDFVSTCRNKYLTNEFFKTIGIQVPKLVNPENPCYPFFVKPVGGSSSNDIHLIRDASYFAPYLLDKKKFLHMEYLPPSEFEEYTVDLYFDRNSKLRCAVPRLRISVRGGEIAKGRTVRGEVYDRVLETFNTIDGARGCITLQLFRKRDCDTLYGIEINPRFGGGYPLSYLAGADYPKMLIKEYIFGETIGDFDNWKDKLLLLRYDAEMVVDEAKS